MTALRLLTRFIDRLNLVAAVVAALAAALLALLLIVEVITTSAFAWSQPWAIEFSTYLLAFVLFCGTGWTLRSGGHIRVAAVTQALPPALRRLMDLAASVFGLGVTGFIAVAMVSQAIRTAEIGSRSFYPLATPLIIPQGLLAAGFVLLALAFLARVLRALVNDPVEDAGRHAGGIE